MKLPRLALVVTVVGFGCGGDDDNGDAWEATGQATTTSTTGVDPTTTSTTDPSTTTGTTSTTGDPTEGSTGTTGAPVVPDPLFVAIAGGEFAPVGMAMGISGRAQLLRAVTGLSTVEVAVVGLAPDTEHAIDVHRLPCALQVGGTRYLLDPGGADNNANRLRIPLTTDANGTARGSVTVDHVVRGDGLSVIVRDPGDSSKAACADLEVDAIDPINYAGSLASFADAETMDETIIGDVTLGVTGGTTTVSAAVMGLTEGETYETAVHLLPCGGDQAGVAYERDPAGPANEANQLRLSLVPDATGTAMASLMVDDHAARPDAQSLVIERVVTDAMMMTTRLKVACADLSRESWPDVLTSRGDMTTSQTGTDRGFDVSGSATLIRNNTGVSTVQASLSGLDAEQLHPVLVYDEPCAAGAGRPYAINPALDEMLESNELWLLTEADDAGDAELAETFGHLARADAMSLVVLDTIDGAVIACADLARP